MSESFGIRRDLPVRFDEALHLVPEALKAEGFGVLTEIDVTATLKTKIDVDFRRYTIIGACNPPSAHRALQANLEVGLMLPCNVTVYEADDGHTVVTAIDPRRTIAAVGDPQLQDLAEEVGSSLTRALDALVQVTKGVSA